MNDSSAVQSTDAAPSESAIIELIEAELHRVGLEADFTDDCAHLDETTALVTTDAMVEGVHFDLNLDTPEQVGTQAAVMNLSDLAASGGRAGWLTWALCLPVSWRMRHIQGLARGFCSTAAQYGARVVGGNLSRTTGPAVITVTAGGRLAGRRPFRRDGARVGDLLYVTGPLGNAALGFLEPDPATRAARHLWRPHLAEAGTLALWDGVSAAMDISDGLLIDAHRIGTASGVGIAIKTGALPVTELYRSRCGQDRELALTGGEDYVLLFTAPADALPPVGYPVGRCLAEPGLWVDDAARPPHGFDHFGGGGD